VPVQRVERKWHLTSTYRPRLFLDSIKANGWDPGVVPESVIYTYARFELYLATQAERYTPNHMLGTGPNRFFLVNAADHRVAVNCLGIGAPATTAQIELQAELGVQRFVILGTAGGLSPDLPPGSIVVPTDAIRDEGTTNHYAAPDEPALPDPSLSQGYASHLTQMGYEGRRGTTWTTGARFRTTAEEIRHYASHGVMTVEEEAAALFVVGKHRNTATAAALVVDGTATLDGEWAIDLQRGGEVLRQLLQPTIDYLANL